MYSIPHIHFFAYSIHWLLGIFFDFFNTPNCNLEYSVIGISLLLILEDTESTLDSWFACNTRVIVDASSNPLVSCLKLL